jgi:hypothetical protein
MVSTSIDTNTPPFVTTLLPFDAHILYEALTQLIFNCGYQTSHENCKIKIHRCYLSYVGTAFMAKNCHKSPVELTMDCSSCEGHYVTHRDGMIHKEVVNPDEKVVFHLLTAKDEFKKTTATYKLSCTWK